jgi:hypothetical protein
MDKEKRFGQQLLVRFVITKKLKNANSLLPIFKKSSFLHVCKKSYFCVQNTGFVKLV